MDGELLMTHLSTETFVRLLTPIFTALAAGLTGWVAKHFPGVTIPTGDLVPLMVLGGGAAAAAALHWLHKQTKLVKFGSDADALLDKLAAKVKSDQVAGPALADIEQIVRAHTAQIVQVIGTAVHAPPSVEEVVQAFAKQVLGSPASTPTAPAVVASAPISPPPVAN